VALKQVLEILDLLESAVIEKEPIENYFLTKGLNKKDLQFLPVKGEKGETTFVKIQIPGTDGRTKGGSSPTLGIIGRLGGIGARPHKIGFVSDADGAIAALASASKICHLNQKGDSLKGDVIISSHLSPSSPIIPHDPVPFMDEYEVDERMEAILSLDATKGNRIINQRGFAISPTVKNGYILRVSEHLLDIMQDVTGKLPVVFAITHQDITPYGNGLHHLNSIMQPATATEAPVVGIAITSEQINAWISRWLCVLQWKWQKRGERGNAPYTKSANSKNSCPFMAPWTDLKRWEKRHEQNQLLQILKGSFSIGRRFIVIFDFHLDPQEFRSPYVYLFEGFFRFLELC
jgi:hypothetical protein